jgi:p-cumate 2,3-dioxygenase beta subunit
MRSDEKTIVVKGVRPLQTAHDASVSDVEHFYHAEAALLDAWRLEDWLDLLTEDARYHVPATDAPNGDPRTSLALVDDDIGRIRSRVKQLHMGLVVGEVPKSRTRRMVTNVRITDVPDDSRLAAQANFVIYRFRRDIQDIYVGHYEYEFIVVGGALKLRRRKAVLDNEELRPHSKLTIIL